MGFLARAVIAYVCLAHPLAASGEEVQAKRTPEQVIKLWAGGPARYLMNAREYEEMGKLKTVPELARFITDFWTRRDPTPGTFENEYRRSFWARILEANRRFRDSTTPGWKTDRGKVFVLLGEPYFVESDEHPRVASGLQRQAQGPGLQEAGERGVERWHYNRHFSRSASPEFIVAFVRDASLDWKLTSNSDLLEPSFPGIAASADRDPSFGGIEGAATRRAPTDDAAAAAVEAGPLVASAGVPLPRDSALLPELDASLLANYDLGLELAVPSSAALILASVSTREFLSAFTAKPRFEFFRAKDGSTFVNVGALVRPKDIYAEGAEGVSTLRLYASLTPREHPSQVRYATNEKNPIHFDLKEGPAPGGAIDLWTGLALPAGRYLATVAIEDSLTGRIGRTSSEVEIPEFPASSLSLSSLVLASSLSESGDRMGVVSRSSSIFRKSESCGVYYEVYGLDRSKQGPRFDATYRFYRETEGGLSPIGKPNVLADRTAAAQGWSFPLSKWPAGRYRLEVTVALPSGAKISAQTPFEVID